MRLETKVTFGKFSLYKKMLTPKSFIKGGIVGNNSFTIEGAALTTIFKRRK